MSSELVHISAELQGTDIRLYMYFKQQNGNISAAVKKQLREALLQMLT
jgi:hypothetical protein